MLKAPPSFLTERKVEEQGLGSKLVPSFSIYATNHHPLPIELFHQVYDFAQQGIFHHERAVFEPEVIRYRSPLHEWNPNFTKWLVATPHSSCFSFAIIKDGEWTSEFVEDREFEPNGELAIELGLGCDGLDLKLPFTQELADWVYTWYEFSLQHQEQHGYETWSTEERNRIADYECRRRTEESFSGLDEILVESVF